MIEIFTQRGSQKFCYFDEDSNMIDITDKCPVELYRNICKALETDDVFDLEFIGDTEEIYTILVEKLYRQPANPTIKLSPIAKDKIKIAFNKFFMTIVGESLNTTVERITYL